MKLVSAQRVQFLVAIIMPFVENGSLLLYMKQKRDLVVPTYTQMDDAKVDEWTSYHYAYW